MKTYSHPVPHCIFHLEDRGGRLIKCQADEETLIVEEKVIALVPINGTDEAFNISFPSISDFPGNTYNTRTLTTARAILRAFPHHITDDEENFTVSA